MPTLRAFRNSLPCILILLTACGGGGDGQSATTNVSVNGASCGNTNVPSGAPGAPQNVSAIAGDQKISVNWSAPASSGGSQVQSYVVCVLASGNAGNDNTAIVVGTSDTQIVVQMVLGRTVIQNGTTYSVYVSATNANGTGPATVPVNVTPSAVMTSAYRPLTIRGDDSPSGIFDPSVIRSSSGTLWMSYSSVNYYADANGRLVQDVGIRLARSDDAGGSFDFVSTIAAPEPASVTDTDPKLSACGAAVCTGRWVYETSWLVDDAGDPDATRRFKLFAHKYFLYPAGQARTLYHLGAIVMWTAASPEGKWSDPVSILGWNLTPPELMPRNLIQALHSDLASCLASSEGGASATGDKLDVVLTCVYPGGDPLPQKIVLLRSADHAKTFQYVSTLLTPEDAVAVGAKFFTAPALVPLGKTTQALIATPTTGAGIYAGCAVFPIANQDIGTLVRQDGAAVTLFNIPPLADHFGGACAWSEGLDRAGILLNDATPGQTPFATKFAILATGRSP